MMCEGEQLDDWVRVVGGGVPVTGDMHDGRGRGWGAVLEQHIWSRMVRQSWQYLSDGHSGDGCNKVAQVLKGHTQVGTLHYKYPTPLYFPQMRGLVVLLPSS